MKMLYNLCLSVLLLCLFHVDLLSQDNPYQYIEKAFDEEFSEESFDENTATEKNQYVYTPAFNIPDWVLNFTSYGPSYMIGISDPDLDSLTGLYQAQLRAIALYSLQSKANLGSLSDLFGKDEVVKLKSVHESLVASKSTIAFPYFCVVNQCQSTFDETLVLLRFDDGNGCKKQLRDSLICLLDIYTQEFEQGDWHDLNKNYSMSLFDQQGECQMNYVTVENSRNQYTIESQFEGQEIVAPNYPFVYILPVNSGENNQSILDGGYWRHFLKAYINGIKTVSELQASTVKSHDERKNEQFQHDINSVSTRSYKLTIGRFQYLPQELKIELSLIE